MEHYTATTTKNTDIYNNLNNCLKIQLSKRSLFWTHTPFAPPDLCFAVLCPSLCLRAQPVQISSSGLHDLGFCSDRTTQTPMRRQEEKGQHICIFGPLPGLGGSGYIPLLQATWLLSSPLLAVGSTGILYLLANEVGLGYKGSLHPHYQ